MICHNFVIQYFESTSLYLSVLRDGLTCWNPYIFKPLGMLDAYPNLFIYSPLATTEVSSRYVSGSSHRTYTNTPFSSVLLMIFLTQLLFVIARNSFNNTVKKQRSYTHTPSPKCSPALTRINNGLLCLPWLKPFYPGSQG